VCVCVNVLETWCQRLNVRAAHPSSFFNCASFPFLKCKIKVHWSFESTWSVWWSYGERFTSFKFPIKARRAHWPQCNTSVSQHLHPFSPAGVREEVRGQRGGRLPRWRLRGGCQSREAGWPQVPQGAGGQRSVRGGEERLWRPTGASQRCSSQRKNTQNTQYTVNLRKLFWYLPRWNINMLRIFNLSLFEYTWSPTNHNT